MIAFGNTLVLLGLVALPLVAWLARRAAARPATARFSDIRHLKKMPPSSALLGRKALAWFRMIALALLVVAMARPQHGIAERNLQARGIDIYLVLDVSGSMQANDFRPNRLEAAKTILKQFIRGRQNDRIGVIVFATHSYTLVPLTLDYAAIENLVDQIHFGIVDENSTAIGSALAAALRRLEDSEAASRVVVLLTDGDNNAGDISPELATEAARALGVRTYTVGVGSQPDPLARGFFGGLAQGAGFDETSLRAIADKTGGRYFAAADERGLENVFREIDRLERTDVQVRQYVNYSEKMAWLVWPALLLLMLEIVLANTRFLKLP